MPTRMLSKGSRYYFEGNLTLSHCHTADGQQRTNINAAAWKLEKIGAIGWNKPRRDGGTDPAFHALIERCKRSPQFDDALDF